MSKELELWQFISSRLKKSEALMLLVVAESSGSSPGRAGYKMAVASDGELAGSIGGGVMEVRLVEKAKSQIRNLKFEIGSELVEQIHRKDNKNSSGMICSGKQTVIFRLLTPGNTLAIDAIINKLETHASAFLTLTQNDLQVSTGSSSDRRSVIKGFEKFSETEFTYTEKLGPKNELFIVGGGHCALALSELMTKMDFRILIFDDRPDLNTIEKNRYANEIKIIDSYEQIGEIIPSGLDIYVVVMTLGYKSDETVIRSLFDKDFKYFGVLGSRAKMKTLLRDLEKDGFSKERLARIRTPIGIPISSRTPEEIAVSIVAEIIAVKNS